MPRRIEKHIYTFLKETLEEKIENYGFWGTVIEALKLCMEEPSRNNATIGSNTRDDHFIASPYKFDYEKWTAKKESLTSQIKTAEFLIKLKSKKIIILENCDLSSGNTCHKVKWTPMELTLEISPSNGYKEKINSLLKEKKISHFSLDLQNLKTALEIELEKTENHIKWLEEDVKEFEEVFNPLNTSKRKKIKTRRLSVENKTKN